MSLTLLAFIATVLFTNATVTAQRSNQTQTIEQCIDACVKQEPNPSARALKCCGCCGPFAKCHQGAVGSKCCIKGLKFCGCDDDGGFDCQGLDYIEIADELGTVYNQTKSNPFGACYYKGKGGQVCEYSEITNRWILCPGIMTPCMGTLCCGTGELCTVQAGIPQCLRLPTFVPPPSVPPSIPFTARSTKVNN
eukprot:TRINITY_DN10403_c0_g1_i2.p1 TRINITY_DN10403_c0_g1~~TRINITY_DN10403_c0_g1_i2.p1  ORF type:complete len:193 (-),score=17.39 TRINITY_DN10403_c0_g1_i2:149-727(-)